ncbi:MAG: aminotransferase class IV [Campylobacterales bacterium]
MKLLETIKALNGECYNLGYHEKRSGIKNLDSYLTPPKDGLYRCRLVYKDDKVLEVTYHPYKKRVVNSLKLVYDDKISYNKKFENRKSIDELFMLKKNCDDIIIVKNNLLTDTTIANIALFKDGIWYTPKKPLLNGTTRMRLIDNGFLKELDISVLDIKSFSKIALLNAMINFDIIANKKIEEIVKC